MGSIWLLFYKEEVYWIANKYFSTILCHSVPKCLDFQVVLFTCKKDLMRFGIAKIEYFSLGFLEQFIVSIFIGRKRKILNNY